MGLFDELTIERDYPEFGIKHGECFQTKSLFQELGQFTLSADGTLVQHRYDSVPIAQPEESWPQFKRVELGTETIAYHGDILLYRERADQEPRELVARFTNGILESLTPLSNYAESSRMLLMLHGAR